MNNYDAWLTNKPEEPTCPECDSKDLDQDWDGSVTCQSCGHLVSRGYDPDDAYDRAREDRYS